MATYSTGTRISETGSLNRTTAGTTSKTVDADKYAEVTFIYPAHLFADTTVSGTDAPSDDGSGATTTKVNYLGYSGNKFIVGGGKTFSITHGATMTFTVDGTNIFEAAGGSGTISAQYVIFSST